MSDPAGYDGFTIRKLPNPNESLQDKINTFLVKTTVGQGAIPPPQDLDIDYGSFTTKKTETRDSFVTGAVRSSSAGRGRPQDISPYALVRFAQLLERGAGEYGARNYQKGMSLDRTCGAVLRHIFQYLAGDRSEDHAAAIMFNGMCLIDTEERIINGQVPKELNDIRTFDLQEKANGSN